MRRPLVPLARRPLLLAALVAILGISLVYSASARRAYLMRDLQYIPVEDELLLVTGNLVSLWEGVDRHFGSVFLEEEEEEIGGLTYLFREARRSLEDKELQVESLDDLVDQGFDVGRGMMMSASETSALFALPVTGRGSVSDVVSAIVEEDPDDEPPDLGLGDVHLVSYGAGMVRRRSGDPRASSAPADTSRYLSVDGLLAYPGDGRALFASDPDHLRRAILNQDRNLVHASADDELYRVIRENLTGSLGSGPTVFGLWSPLATPGIQRMTGVLALRPDALGLGVEVKVDVGVLRLLDDFLAPAEMSDEWHRYLGPETAAAVAVEDEALSDHLGFLRRFETIGTFMDDAYGGVLTELEGLPGLHRVVLAVTGYRDGLPELVMGVWGDPDSLKGLVSDAQLRHREERDRAVLEGAVEAYLEQQVEQVGLPDFSPQVSVQALEEAAILVPEEGSTFHRYAIRAAGGAPGPSVVVEPGTLVPEDLRSPGYLRFHGSEEIRFVLPPVTDNDIAHLPGLADVDEEVLRGDRYRLATVVLDSVLWIATDLMDVRDQIDRAAAGPGNQMSDLSENEAFQAARTTWSRSDRIQGFLDIERLTTLGLLSPESDVEEVAKLLLLDFRNHPSVSLAVRSEGTRERVMINVAAFLQRRLRDR